MGGSSGLADRPGPQAWADQLGRTRLVRQLVPKVTHAGEAHRHPKPVGSLDDLWIAH